MHSPAASAFESAVLAWIAARSGDEALRQQLATAQIAERDHTGVGCYSRLRIESDAPRSSASYASRGPLQGPNFESKAVEYGGGTQLWFKLGLADSLEIYAHGNYFPSEHEELGEFVLQQG